MNEFGKVYFSKNYQVGAFGKEKRGPEPVLSTL